MPFHTPSNITVGFIIFLLFEYRAFVIGVIISV